MPTTFPRRRPTGFNRWHYTGLAVGYAAAMLALLWVAIYPFGKADLPGVTTGIAPADQSGKPLPR
jgi:hypothetical protein